MVRVKICGITRLEDAQAAVAAGADAVGFIFAKSPRRVSLARAAGIARKLGPWVTKVGVFVNEPASGIARTLKRCGLDVAQLHGEEPSRTAKSLRREGFPVIKAFRVGRSLQKGAIGRYPTDAILLDTAAPGLYGGTGRTFDWKLLNKIRLRKPVIVSGGLDPGNVRRLLKAFQPYGVDVSSGVETSPGKKSAKKIREFIHNAKSI